MKVTEKKLGSDRVRLDVIASVDEVAGALQTAQVSFARSMGLTPERGKTVAQVAEEKMGIKNLDSIVAGEAAKSLVPFALNKKNIAPLFMPEPRAAAPLERGCKFAFSLEVALKPKYELSSYEPVEISVRPFVMDEGLVEAQLRRMSEGYVSYQTAAPKPVEAGDCCLISMECYEDGELVERLSATGRTYVAGQGYMPAGFDEGIYGMVPGETRTFTFEGPRLDDESGSATQTVECTVTVIEIQQTAQSEIDDAWVQKNMPWYQSYEALRKEVAEGIERQERMKYDGYVRQLAANEISKRFVGKIADKVYEATRENIVNNIRLKLKQEGRTWEDFLRDSGGEDQVSMMLMFQTRDALVQGFALDAVYRYAKLTITDEDIEEACLSINPHANPKQLRSHFEQSGQLFALRESAERVKANKWLVDQAKITLIESE